ncbi:hypothetical protein GQ600_15579 [Phytophthora cactorum]|nr:hypothetical protein GQ600_15579 [Phytophthora cactorum]
MMRHVPMHFSSNSTQEGAARQFTGFMLDTATEDALKIGNRMEKLLLQDKGAIGRTVGTQSDC